MFPSVRPMSAFCRIFSLKYDYSIVTEDYFSKDSLYKLICTVGMGGTGSPPRETPVRPIQKRDRGRKKRLSDWALHPSSISLSNVSFCVPILGSKNVTCLSDAPALRGFQRRTLTYSFLRGLAAPVIGKVRVLCYEFTGVTLA